MPKISIKSNKLGKQ
jgi:hypothetical protein